MQRTKQVITNVHHSESCCKCDVLNIAFKVVQANNIYNGQLIFTVLDLRSNKVK
jgi:hypothetical protein